MTHRVLVFRAGRRLCGLDVAHVVETMRPLPIETLPHVPPFVRGVSIVRGALTPIVDLRALLGGDDEPSEPARLVTLRVEDARRVGLLVDEVLGIARGRELRSEAQPPLLRDASEQFISELTRLDDRLVTVLAAARVVPAEVWEQVSLAKASR